MRAEIVDHKWANGHWRIAIFTLDSTFYLVSFHHRAGHIGTVETGFVDLAHAYKRFNAIRYNDYGVRRDPLDLITVGLPPTRLV